MGNVFWISGLGAAAFMVLQATESRFGSSANGTDWPGQVHGEVEALAFARPAVGNPISFELDTGSLALATAAFGMAALQPETFDKAMVVEIIYASPLAEIEKTQLVAQLYAAEIGQAELDTVLSDIRIALAVE